MILKALYPFAYLTINHHQKRSFDWWYPLLMVIISIAAPAVFNMDQYIDFYGSDGIVRSILNFVQSLPGFYIAALAAISTFSKSDMDKIMPNPAPTFVTRTRGKKEVIKLTRRRFLSAMFSFLTAESILITIMCVLAISFNGALKNLISPFSYEIAKITFMCIILFLFYQMTLATFLGLYYLGYRIHQPE